MTDNNKPTMIGYITDQDRALKAAFDERSVFTAAFIELFKTNDIKKIYLLGSGTSYNASIAGKYYFEKYLKVEAIADIPTHFSNYTDPEVNGLYEKKQIMVIGISQSGTSVSTIAAVGNAYRMGYVTVAVTDDMESPITHVTDHVVKLDCGKELIPVETRGYSVTVLELFLIAVEAGYALGRISEEEYKSILAGTTETLNDYTQVRNDVEAWYAANAAELQQMDHGVIAGYGLNTCTAVEGVLKLGETYKHPVISYDIEEMIHGPQNAFNDKTFVFIVASKEAEYDRVPLFIKFFDDNQITDHLFIITDGQLAVSEKGLKIRKPALEDLSPLYFTLPFQILSARNCIACGIDTSVRTPHRKAFAHIYKEDKA